MGKKLTNRQDAAVKRVANRLGMSDQTVRTIVTEYLVEQSARPAARRTAKPPEFVCPECGRVLKSQGGLTSHTKAKHP